MGIVNVETGYCISDIEELFAEYGITCRSGKGDYRIMGGKKGSSLNLNKTNIVVYTRDDDFKRILAKGLEAEDLQLIENENMRDGIRPNKVVCNSKQTLKTLLEIYAMNAVNKK